MAKIFSMCWKCGKDINASRVLRTDVCSDCGADLHVCKNCVFYDPGSHYDCHESVEDPVNDKERANFCDDFKPKSHFAPRQSASDQLKKLNSLFNI